MLIQLLYFDGCPHWTLAEERMAEAMRKVDRVVPIEKVRIETMDDANRMHFTGSPTILIDGEDPFSEEDATPRMACRVYPSPAGLSGAPTVDQLVSALS